MSRLVAFRGAPAVGKSWACRQLGIRLPGWIFVSLREFLSNTISKDQAFDCAIEASKYYLKLGRNVIFDSSLRRAEGCRKLSELPCEVILFSLFHSDEAVYEKNWERRRNQNSFTQKGDIFTIEPQKFLKEIPLDASDPHYIDQVLALLSQS